MQDATTHSVAYTDGIVADSAVPHGIGNAMQPEPKPLPDDTSPVCTTAPSHPR